MTTSQAYHPTIELNSSNLHRLLEGLVNGDTLHQNILAHLRAFYAQSAATKSAQPLPTEQELAVIFARADGYERDLAALRQSKENGDISLEEWHKAAKKLTRKLANLTNIVYKRMSFGKKCESLIAFIAHLVVRQIEDLVLTNPKEAADYITGKNRTFRFETYTSSLATSLNKAKNDPSVPNDDKPNGEGSFTGVSGYYAALKACGFMPFKTNLDEYGRIHPKGRKVVMTIDLNWIFGFDLNVLNPANAPKVKNLKAHAASDETTALTPPNEAITRGNSVILLLENIVNTVQSPITVVENAQIVGSQLISEGERVVNDVLPTSSEENEVVKGRNSKEAPPVAPPPPTAAHINVKGINFPVPIPQMALEMSRNACRELMGTVYTPENLANGRVGTNKKTRLLAVSEADMWDILLKMVENYRVLHREGESWAGTDLRIRTIIARTARYLQTHPSWVIYAPLQWLDVTFKANSLRTYCENWMPQTADTHTDNATQTAENQPIVFKKIEAPTPSVLFNFVEWFIEQGASRTVVNRRLRATTEKNVVDSIRYGKTLVERGFRPKKDKISFIMGVIDARNPDIGDQADGQEALLAAGNMLRAKNTEGSKKAAKVAAEPTAEASKERFEVWTDARVRGMIANTKLGLRNTRAFTDAIIQRIADHAKAKQSNEATVGMWLSAVNDGKVTQFHN